MNFTYKNNKEKTIIKKVDKLDNKIIITYLDNSTKEVELSEENENKILNLLLKQAIERDKSDALNKAIARKNNSMLIGVLSAILADITLRNFFIESDLLIKLINLILFYINVTNVIKLGKNYEICYKEVDEIKKYRIYLQLKEQLEKKQDICENNEEVTIDNIDDFSLQDIKNLKKSLVKSNRFNFKN